MINKYKYFLLVIIVLFAFFIRIIFVDKNPPSLSWDEVSIGYNAFSILKTGKDEHGRWFPLDTFAAYGDYKPPVAIYITVLSVALFGLNEFSIRFPTVIFGTFTVALTYFLVNSLIPSYKKITVLALLSSFVLALSPWHIQLSRAGYEATIALFWIVLGIVFALKAKINSAYLTFCWIPFVIAIYTFNSSRYVGPLIVVVLVIYLLHVIRNNYKKTVVGFAITFFLLMPIMPHIFSPEARLRYAEVNIFSDASIVTKANARISTDGGTLWAKIIHNRRWYFFRSYINHYLDHFEPKFLFTRGDGNPKFSTQDTGQFYLFESVFLLVGIFLFMKTFPRQSILLLCWLLLSIVPAATARETPHALRILNSIPTWHVFISFGVLELFNSFKFKKIYIIGILICYVISFTYFTHSYFVYYPNEFSGEWQWGYRESLNYIKTYDDKYHSIVMTDSIGRPYMYTLFYTRYDPNKFLVEKKSFFDAAGFYQVSGFGKYSFIRGTPTTWEKETIYILDPSNVPQNAITLSTIKLLNGKTILVVFKI